MKSDINPHLTSSCLKPKWAMSAHWPSLAGTAFALRSVVQLVPIDIKEGHSRCQSGRVVILLRSRAGRVLPFASANIARVTGYRTEDMQPSIPRSLEQCVRNHAFSCHGGARRYNWKDMTEPFRKCRVRGRRKANWHNPSRS